MRYLTYLHDNIKRHNTWTGDHYFTTVGGSKVARFLLLEFENETDAEEFAYDANLHLRVNGREEVCELRSVMLLAGEGDKEDTEDKVSEGVDCGGLSNVCSA